MKFKCRLGFHKFTKWFEVRNHIQRECLNCGKVQAKYPPLDWILAKFLCDIAVKTLEEYVKRLQKWHPTESSPNGGNIDG